MLHGTVRVDKAILILIEGIYILSARWWMIRTDRSPNTCLALHWTSLSEVAMIWVIKVGVSVSKWALLSHVGILLILLSVATASVGSVTCSGRTCLGTMQRLIGAVAFTTIVMLWRNIGIDIRRNLAYVKIVKRLLRLLNVNLLTSAKTYHHASKLCTSGAWALIHEVIVVRNGRELSRLSLSRVILTTCLLRSWIFIRQLSLRVVEGASLRSDAIANLTLCLILGLVLVLECALQ